MEWECATQTQMEFYSKHSSSSCPRSFRYWFGYVISTSNVVSLPARGIPARCHSFKEKLQPISLARSKFWTYKVHRWFQYTYTWLDCQGSLIFIQIEKIDTNSTIARATRKLLAAITHSLEAHMVVPKASDPSSLYRSFHFAAAYLHATGIESSVLRSAGRTLGYMTRRMHQAMRCKCSQNKGFPR
eukprot:Selendium_serpulae@DN3332_c0_g1_i2.p1